MRCAETDQVGLVAPIDGVNRIINCGVHDGKAAGRMDGCRLRARGADND